MPIVWSTQSVPMLGEQAVVGQNDVVVALLLVDSKKRRQLRVYAKRGVPELRDVMEAAQRMLDPVARGRFTIDCRDARRYERGLCGPVVVTWMDEPPC